MLTTITCNLLDRKFGVIAHGVNCQGVMSSGVALQIKETYPKAFEGYKRFIRECRTGDLLGSINLVRVTDDLLIANVFTQFNYGSKGKFVSYDAVDKAFEKLANMTGKMADIAMPMIGAGRGGGNWQVLSAILRHRLEHHNVTVYTL